MGSLVGISVIIFVLLYLTGVIFKGEDPSGGTVVLEIDQPELLGAEVFIDGEKKITITKADGRPVRIKVDTTSGKIEVRKPGFQTFTKEYSFASGGEENIYVMLISRDGEFGFTGVAATNNDPADFDPVFERQVAERVIELGGQLQIEFPAAPGRPVRRESGRCRHTPSGRPFGRPA